MGEFRLSVRYAAGHTQEMKELTAEQIETGSRAFANDIVRLKGEGIREMTVSLEADHVPCGSFVHHGPGHQSRTRCMEKGPHEVHEADLPTGPASWRGGDAFTDADDSPPEVED